MMRGYALQNITVHRGHTSVRLDRIFTGGGAYRITATVLGSHRA
jgi:hypothetical protein